MIARELLSIQIPQVKTSDTGDKALIWMHEFNVEHLPIVNEEQFLGLISEDDILDLSDPTEPIGNHSLSLFKPFVFEEQHIYEVIRIAAEMKLTLVPVVDREERYKGVISREEMIKYIANFLSITENGGILTLEMNKNDYSLSEIARIVESNEAQILSSQISGRSDAPNIEVTLKLSVSDIRAIIASFERFSYVIKGYHQEEGYFDQLKERYDSLMNYLNY